MTFDSEVIIGTNLQYLLSFGHENDAIKALCFGEVINLSG